jgi:DNA-directed RNA polymerase subunit RPC12/RpoP
MSKSSYSDTYVRCSSCRNEVFRELRRCPHCGHRLRWKLKSLLVWLAAGTIAVLLSIALAHWLEDGGEAPAALVLDNPGNS